MYEPDFRTEILAIQLPCKVGSNFAGTNVSQTDQAVPALQLHLCLSMHFSYRSLLARLLPISPTDPITNCFLTGRELPCSAEEAGASLLLCVI